MNLVTPHGLQKILYAIKHSLWSGDGYSIDKKVIRRVFNLTDGSRTDDVMARLALIDGMYSTQMNRRYYPLEDLAGMLVALEKNAPLKNTFMTFTKDLDPTQFNINGKGNLWSNGYGVGKDGNPKGAAVSLISKYAYFETGYKFPIYDSIACEVLPILWSIVMGNDDVPKLTINNSKQQMMGKETIVSFLKAVNMLAEELGADADYDTLDRLMWYTGKMLRGNFSLVFSKEEYVEWADVAKKIGMKFKDEDLIDAVIRIDVKQLPFLDKEENTFVKMIYELAQKLKTLRCCQIVTCQTAPTTRSL
ncbi:MAG: hypothetical protein IKQ53_05740 [Bacteroidales bacterium]|nr:hypothetical protein [Bacteroidales bacterium]